MSINYQHCKLGYELNYYMSGNYQHNLYTNLCCCLQINQLDNFIHNCLFRHVRSLCCQSIRYKKRHYHYIKHILRNMPSIKTGYQQSILEGINLYKYSCKDTNIVSLMSSSYKQQEKDHMLNRDSYNLCPSRVQFLPDLLYNCHKSL